MFQSQPKNLNFVNFKKQQCLLFFTDNKKEV